MIFFHIIFTVLSFTNILLNRIFRINTPKPVIYKLSINIFYVNSIKKIEIKKKLIKKTHLLEFNFEDFKLSCYEFPLETYF